MQVPEEEPDRGAVCDVLARVVMPARAAVRPLFQRAFAILRRALGPDHPYTVTVRANLEGLGSSLNSW